MRGEQTGVGVEQPGDDRATYSFVLVLISGYVALTLVSVFVMDWLVLFANGWSFGQQESVDLWAATRCDPSFGCVSTPLEKLGYQQFRPFAVMTLWTTAASSAFVLLRCGAYLLGLRMWRGVTAWAYGMISVSVATVLVLALEGVPKSKYTGIEIHTTPAPFVLLAAHVLGLIALAATARSGGRVRPDRAPRIPRARVVNG